jgi:hypothetical protein
MLGLATAGAATAVDVHSKGKAGRAPRIQSSAAGELSRILE